MKTNSAFDYAFDHLVIIARDDLDALSSQFSERGFQITPKAHHNLGSSNRLIMLDSSYIELLGWCKGEMPKRAEIAEQPIGLDAIVFRTNDAEACYQRLKDKGFLVNSVQELTRESEYNNTSVLVKFKTVRFSAQPIAGLRIYFCEHITPQYVWQEQWLNHPNHLEHLAQITISSSDVINTTEILKRLLDLCSQQIITDPKSTHLTLSNIQLKVQFDKDALHASIQNAQAIKYPPNPVDFIINSDFFNHL